MHHPTPAPPRADTRQALNINVDMLLKSFMQTNAAPAIPKGTPPGLIICETPQVFSHHRAE
jgi:hypothetical protein